MKRLNLLSSGTYLFWPLLVMGIPTETRAIPVFARKYKTSCQTCHVAYPKLTPFGEAYRQNGFQWPGDLENEEANIKDEPVKTGAEVYKRVFPQAVWPGAIPGGPPLSFRARSGFNWAQEGDQSRSAFDLPTLQIMMGGTLGDNVGFFVGAHLFEEGNFARASVDRFYLKLNNLLSGRLPDNALYLRLGQFIPELVTFASNHRGLSLTSYAFNTYAPSMGTQFSAGHAHGAGGENDEHGEGDDDHDEENLPSGSQFGLENFQLGLEASGIVKGRWRYVLGLVNGGSGAEKNQAKDGFFRLAYKLGGMAYDGTDGAGESSQNWVDNSIALGIFGYRGSAYNEITAEPEDLQIQRLGLDVNGFLGGLNLYGGFLRGSDELLSESGHAHGVEEIPDYEVETVDFTLFFAEANYVIYPWLIGVLRFEQAGLDKALGEIDRIQRIVPSLTILYRANIKFVVESRLDPDNLDFNVLQVGLDFAY